jgi:hypothetical protein
MSGGNAPASMHSCPVVGRALHPLDAFGPRQRELTLSEIARGRFALTATGVGLVLLAHAPVEVQEEVSVTRSRCSRTPSACPPRDARTCLEAELVITALAERAERLEPTGDPVARLNNTLKGWASVPVKVHPA